MCHEFSVRWVIFGRDLSLKANGNLPVGFNKLCDLLLSLQDREYLGFTCTGCRFLFVSSPSFEIRGKCLQGQQRNLCRPVNLGHLC